MPHLSGGEFLGLCGIMLGVIGILGGVLVAITKAISEHRRRMQLDDIEATLKMEMIQRGMSAGEIKQVLEARVGGGGRNINWKDFVAGFPDFSGMKAFSKRCERP